MNEVKKQETREKRTGSLAIQGEKNKPESSASKNEKASGTLTDSPVLKENESESYVPVSAATVKEYASHNNENSSLDEENNKNQMKK
jgi:hypothetical protein